MGRSRNVRKSQIRKWLTLLEVPLAIINTLLLTVVSSAALVLFGASLAATALRPV